MANEDDQYQVTEADVTWAIEYMKLNHNKEITRDTAIKLLHRLYIRQKTLEKFSPEAMEEELKDLEDY